MQIELSGKITIRWLDAKLLNWLANNYTINNPEYIIRARLNKWLKGIPKFLTLYTQYNTDMVTLPYGCFPELMAYVWANYDPLDVDVIVHLNKDKTADWCSDDNHIVLRDYQREAVDAMKSCKVGILKAPCSSGKTVMGHILAQEIGMKTLWLTHKISLLNQSKAIGELILGKDRIGTISDGKAKIGSTITYATVQTLAKMDVSLYQNEFNCLIVDECHRITTKTSSSQMAYVANHINAEYKYGLSATPETHDGYFRTVLCNLGNIRHEIDKDILEESGSIMPVTVQKIDTGWTYPEEAFNANGAVDFNEAVSLLANDEERNRKIVNLIGFGKPTLVISNSIDQLVYIMNELPPILQSRACLVTTKHNEDILTAKDVLRKHTTKQREKYIDMLRYGELDIMFATYQLAKEGLNIPRLEQVIMAYPAIDPNIITQTVGRVARTSPGKDSAICYDLVDRPKYFQKKFTERKRIYKKQGIKVI